MHRTNIYLVEDQTAALDEIAVDEGISRAELIRRLIDEFLAGGRANQRSDIEAIESSAGVLADMQIGDRDEDARAEHLHRMWRMGGHTATPTS